LIVAELSRGELRRRLRGPGLRLRTGPFVTCIRSPLERLAETLALLYAQHPVEDAEGFADFHVSVARPSGPRRWIRSQVLFRFDDTTPFAPMPGGQGFPMLEWGLNWCVSSHCHQYLILHAAVLERHGRALILPAPSGAGKSTLCAALMFSGWRLLSDELTLIDPTSDLIVPLPRPVGLKNASIDVVRRFAAEAIFSPVVRETIKGSVAHLKPVEAAVRRALEPALAAWVVVPHYLPGAQARIEPYPKAQAFMRLVEGSFNYHVHGRAGFEALARLIDRSECHSFSYSRLEDAATVFERLAVAHRAAA
jgi:HprK-related kinase A